MDFLTAVTEVALDHPLDFLGAVVGFTVFAGYLHMIGH
jgi:hypothetical protein